MKAMSESATIPASAAPFFQEYRFDQLDPDRHASLVIERLLAYGNRAELRWLFETYGQARIRAWVAEMGAYHLPRRRCRLWCVLLDLPQPERRPGIWPY
jgi:hypothetical protein